VSHCCADDFVDSFVQCRPKHVAQSPLHNSVNVASCCLLHVANCLFCRTTYQLWRWHGVHVTWLTSSAKTRDLLTLLMIQTAKVKRPDGDADSRLAASGHLRQLRRHCRQEFSSSKARLSTGGGQRVCWFAWLNCTARSRSKSRVTPSRGSPMNSWTKLQRETRVLKGDLSSSQFLKERYCDILILWYTDIMIYWYYDILILWYTDIVIYWYYDILILWYTDIVIYWYYDILILWYTDIMIYWYYDILLLLLLSARLH
jgi:hypothetical protein